MTVADLPLINSCLNGSAALLLTLGFILIKMGKPKAHGAVMSLALIVSAAFLGCYLTYHYFVGHVRFAGTGGVKTFYYSMLISHVLLAIVNLPLVFLTVIPAIRDRWAIHQRWAKITLPIWMYVSVTGVLVYLMCHVWYGPPLSSH